MAKEHYVRVSSVNNYTPNFGYDKKLNNELKAKLSVAEDKVTAGNVSALNDLCNKTEDSLRLTVIQDNQKERVEKNKLLFLRLKEALASCVTTMFPELNFAEREQQSYSDEFEKTKTPWLQSAICILDTYKKVPAIEKTQQSILPEILGKPELPKTQAMPKVAPETEQLVEEFIPTKYSPSDFSEVVGMRQLKDSLTEDIINPITDPKQAAQDFIDYGKEFPRGLLMFGPPGCGKTYITEALANEAKTKMYKLSIGKAGSSFINLTSNNIKNAFEYIGMLGERSERPVILFMDEIDSLGFDRTTRTDNEDIKQVSTLLQSMDDIRSKNVIIIAATNKPDLIDAAVKRRFDGRAYVGLPDAEVRLALVKSGLEKKAKGEKLLNDEESLEQIVQLLDGYSNSAICNVNKNAALNAMRRDRADIELQDYVKAVDECQEDKYNEDDYKPEQLKKKNTKKIGFNQG